MGEMTFRYKPKTDDELRELALAAQRGDLFGSWMCRSPEEIRMVWSVPLLFMKPEMAKAMEGTVAHLYSYMRDVNPVGCNGLPSFMGFKTLDKADCEKLKPMLAELRRQDEEFLQAGKEKAADKIAKEE